MSEKFLHGVQVLEVNDGPRPIRTVHSSVIGLVGYHEGDGVYAFAEIGTGDAKIKFQAKTEGESGNSITIRTLKPSTANSSLSVSVASKEITVSIATDGSSVAVSTAAQIITAVNASAQASALVHASLSIGSSGGALYSAHAATPLVGGADPSFPLDTPVLVTSARNIDAQLGADSYLGKALEAIYKQAGAVCVVVRTESEAGDATLLTGVHALKRAQTALGYTPRIILAENASHVSVIDDVKSVANALRAVAIVGLTAETSATAATSWVTANGNDRTFALWPAINGGQDPAPFVAGVLAKSDNDRGFWWSPSNQEVLGIESLDYPVDWQLGDTTSLANILNEGNVTTFIRQGGFRIWGNRTGSIDAKWAFLSVRRTADMINDSIKRAHLWAVDRNITKTYLDDVTESVNAYLRSLENQEAILGGRCWPDPDLNSPDQIAQGKVYFNFDFTPPYPAEHITFRSMLVNDYLVDLV